jgi:hypothetical protein
MARNVVELHRLGIPVLLASQLPFTMAGSVVMAREFYRYLLEGDDVRRALHDLIACCEFATLISQHAQTIAAIGSLTRPVGSKRTKI